jgi:Tol biopolymer transport system component
VKIFFPLIIITALSFLLFFGYVYAGNPVPEYFCIGTVNLDGSGFKEILKDPHRQINHIRVSNDHQWITFTRFNKLNSDGVAIEEEGYEQTEIMLGRSDGTDLRTVAPPKKGAGNANSRWTPDNRKIVYISTENPSNVGRIFTFDLAAGKREQVKTASGFEAADPFIWNNLMAYTARMTNDEPYAIRLMKMDGTDDLQVTFPQKGAWGDFDPHISPDSSAVVFMRGGREKQNGKVILVSKNLRTGVETVLSEPSNDDLDGMPEWSSDGRLILYWHIDRKDHLKSGLYTMHPDGTNRRRIPLPIGYHYGTAAFFPGTGSSSKTKIVFAARRFPPEIRKKLEEYIKRQKRP